MNTLRPLSFFILAAAQTVAFGYTIDFSSDAPGAISNGFTSAGYAGAHFSDSNGADLVLGNFGAQTNGVGLVVFGDDPSALVIDFDGLMNSISLRFGNDDPNVTSASDIALLTLFNGATQVGQTSVVLNRDDIMNQTIAFSGAGFNRATFVYASANGTPLNLIEVVDDITFSGPLFSEAPIGEVPDGGSTLGLLGLALAGLVAWRRRT